MSQPPSSLATAASSKRKPSEERGDSTKAVDLIGQTLTVGQALQYFALSLKKPNNYLRIVRRYLEYCIEHRATIDQVSSSLYASGQRPSLVSPVRKFIRFAAEHQITHVVADPEQIKVPPAANELILGYLSEANLLEESKITYTKSLNAFFLWMDRERAKGSQVSFSHNTVRKYLDWMRKQQVSPFTIQVRLSAIKGLARWVVDHHDRLPGVAGPKGDTSTSLDRDQLDALRGIDQIRAPRLEQQFHRDGLSEEGRTWLLDCVADSKWQAIITLMGWCGLRTVEVIRLKVRDVDFSASRLYVQGKGKEDKVAVQLLEECAYFLALYLDEYNLSNIGKGTLFPGLTTRQIRYHTGKFLKKAGLKTARVSAHSLRHTTGQILLKQGVDPIYVQRHLRHKSFATTQIYVQQQTEKEYFKNLDDKP
ncbi:MAG: tyrosine-type recombinase/integrase [Tunicatimonas sp.]